MNNEQLKSKGLITLQEYNDKVKSGEIERTAPKTPLQKWEEDKMSLRKSCNAMCYACMGGDMGDNLNIEAELVRDLITKTSHINHFGGSISLDSKDLEVVEKIRVFSESFGK